MWSAIAEVLGYLWPRPDQLTHLFQIQGDCHILKLTATLQCRRLPPALLVAGAGRNERFNRSLLGTIGAVGITGAAVFGSMRKRIHHFTIFLGSILATGRVHWNRCAGSDIEQRREKPTKINRLVCLLSVAQAQICKEIVLYNDNCIRSDFLKNLF